MTPKREALQSAAYLSVVFASVSFLAAVAAVLVQRKSSSFPFGENDFDLVGLGLMLANIVCLALCWVPAAVSVISGVVAMFSKDSRRVGLCGIIISLLSVAIYLLATSLFV